MGADRVELYTEPFAAAFARGAGAGGARCSRRTSPRPSARTRWASASTRATTSISTTWRSIASCRTWLEVSIGHALIGRALFRGSSVVADFVREYLAE